MRTMGGIGIIGDLGMMEIRDVCLIVILSRSEQWQGSKETARIVVFEERLEVERHARP